MRSTITRLIIIAVFFAVAHWWIEWDKVFSLLFAFMICFIVEPWLIETF